MGRTGKGIMSSLMRALSEFFISYLWPGSAFCLRKGVTGFVLGKQGVERRGGPRLEGENANTWSSPVSSARAPAGGVWG